ncbi:MarR family transcriptional regulator [Listeria monocytogenes]|nr:MarR family transcriptional regulator [Listeria monocytogenes]
MDNFTFVDRPSSHRIQAMADTNLEMNTELAKFAELFIDFQWTYRNMQKMYDHLLNKNDLSESRFIILMFLKGAPNHELLPSEIAEKLGATRATASKLLKAMEVKEWISKNCSSSDKRSLPVQLTKDGKKVLDNFLPKNFKFVEQLFENLSNEEIKQLIYLLSKIKEGTQKCSLIEEG